MGFDAYKQKAAQQNLQGQYAGYTPEQYGVINEYQSNSKDPYWEKWLGDLKSGSLQGSPLYFFDKYKQQKSGEDAIAKQADISKQLAAGAYGQQQEGMQAGFAGAGMAKSGFAGQEFADLAAQENLTFSDIQNRMLAQQQDFRNQNKEQWQNERYQIGRAHV